MRLPFFQIDAFTDRHFSGNPAGVVPDAGNLTDGQMQAIATEVNCSETAFLEQTDKSGSWRLRWFTPTDEVELCGHATLAAAHALWTSGRIGTQEDAHFSTASGPLTARHEGNMIWMDFPAEPPQETKLPDALQDLFATEPTFVGANRMDLLVVLDSADAVREWTPDQQALEAVERRGVILTAPADSDDADFISRFFAPRVGVPEDPVTGSAHCCLAPYWADRLGRNELKGYQASRRGGHVWTRLEGDRVQLGGQAVTVLSGELALK